MLSIKYIFIFYANLIHEQLDDHDDPLKPLYDLKHLLLIDLLLEEDHPDRVDLEDDLLEPELVCLVGDDEEVLVMYLRPCNRWIEAVLTFVWS